MSDLTTKQAKALAALISQPTLGLAATHAGVTERTLYRWLAEDAAFKAEYLRLRREIVASATFALQKASNNAVNALVSVMNDPEAPASSRVQAAKVVLEMSLKALEVDDLEARIAALEGMLNGTAGR
jgi:hypothetical protein